VKLTHYLRAIFVGIGLASIPLSSSADFVSGNTLLSHIEVGRGPNGLVAAAATGLGYLQGVVDALNQMDLTCMPKTSVTVGQIERIVHKYLVNHPEGLHRGASVLVYLALDEAFPCPKKP
jgi:hypothetical protein